MSGDKFAVCPVCGALTVVGAPLDHHLYWHDHTGTLNGWTADDARRRVGQADHYRTVPR
jgi:hypothetical protein